MVGPVVARNGPAGSVRRCPLIGIDRKWQIRGRNDAIDHITLCTSLRSFVIDLDIAEALLVPDEWRSARDQGDFDDIISLPTGEHLGCTGEAEKCTVSVC